MALPIAPLGQMSSINLPNYVPNTVVPDRNPLNLALAAFLQGAMSNAGGTIASNTLSRDFAADVGQTPATGLGKVFNGPKVNAAQLSQQKGNDAINARLDKEIAATNSRLDKTIGAQKAEFDVTSAQTNRRLDQADTNIKDNRDQFKKTSEQTDTRINQGFVDAAQRQQEINARLDQLVKEGQLTDVRAKAISVEMAKTQEEVRGLKGQNDYLDKIRNPAPKENPLKGAKMPSSTSTPTDNRSVREVTAPAAQEAASLGASLQSLLDPNYQPQAPTAQPIPVAIPGGGAPVFASPSAAIAPSTAVPAVSPEQTQSLMMMLEKLLSGPGKAQLPAAQPAFPNAIWNSGVGTPGR